MTEELKRCEDFMDAAPPPSNLSQTIDNVRVFISKQIAKHRHVVLVTSGGTSVPLERNTVRYLDNFSGGGRGSASAEAFLRSGYAVIFVHRAGSLRPFHRHITSRDLLDYLVVDKGGNMTVDVEDNTRKDLVDVVSRYHKAREDESLLFATFTTLFDYGHLLREISQLMKPLESRAVLYLAAAVSDYYIPYEGMTVHKLSSSHELTLSFQQTPKLLTLLRHDWAPLAFTVTFKLETDSEVLVPHARAALKKYGHQVVVANLLQTRYSTVTIVTEQGEEEILRAPEREIENDIIDIIITKHSTYMTL